MTSPLDIAHEIIDATLYMVLATADETGRPWSSPVYFAHRDYREFFWVSAPGVRHSANIAVRPEVGIAIFDTSAPIGRGQGVYASAVAEMVEPDRIAPAIEVFSRRSLSHGGYEWTPADVRDEMRLYRAVADQHWILAKDGTPDHRVPV
jgi:pyridoxamine 5'-phosphate oxidase-like protein